ncbi:MAG: DEAD/DEAH box helicase [Desulfobacteraceae bacterium]|nr:DEAD/DEAH box helicase [Desulfobacteraceae bacterium]
MSIILRKRQKIFVQKCITSLKKHKNTLGVANTGFGKTIALSAICGERINKKKKALIMAHRDELTRQNSAKFQVVNPDISISLFNAEQKSFLGRAVFSMVQTLSMEKHLVKMQPVDLLVVDEAHHSASDTYQRVIGRAKELNKKVEILGVTATPERSDNKGLRKTFSNVADVVTIGEMIQAGHLVPPKALVIDIGTQTQLKNVKKTANDYDQAEVEAIQNTKFNNDQIVVKWLELAKDRPTVIFSSTIAHAEDVMEAFRDAGVDARVIHSKLGIAKRREILEEFDNGEFLVLVNPMVLTEGWDCQICSCVILLRVSSHKSVVIQMVGRGLRKVDPDQHPGVIKRDCLILDFGISLINAGNLNSTVILKDDGKPGDPEDAQKKSCPDCASELPIQTRTCPLCGYEFKVELDENGFYDEAQELRLIEIDLINISPFRWIQLWDSERILIANGFDAWACVCSVNGEDWFSIGGLGRDVKVLGITNRSGAIASSDDFMRQNESARTAKKAAAWMNQPASQKQMQTLLKFGMCQILNKIQAAAYLTFHFNRSKIERLMGV